MFVDIWVCQGGQGYTFKEVDVRSAPSELELQDALEDMPEDHPARLRLAQVAALAPPFV